MKESAASGRSVSGLDATVTLAAPKPEAVSPAVADLMSLHDALFGRLAVHNGFVEQRKLDDAISQQKTTPTVSLANILVQSGAVSEDVRRAVEQLLLVHITIHKDDPQQSLSTLPVVSTKSQGPPNSDETANFVPKPGNGQPPHKRFGEYELLAEIARGGMGVVYKARQAKLNRLVALKMIRSGELADDEQVKRFYAEAEAAAKLDHPGIVPVYEVGEANGQHFFSMALVVGTSLNDRVKNDGPLPPKEAARLLKLVVEAVEYAHGKGVIHRDIKPQNILLDEAGQPRLTDFGLAKQMMGQSDLTATGQVMGTPSYMPPEQASGKLDEIGPISDVYSLGASLYFVLTGRPPFQTASPVETIQQVLHSEPVALRRLNPAVPRDLETICLKCLRKEPAKRYATAAELAADLGRWLENRPIVARPVSTTEHALKWVRRQPLLAGLYAFSGLSLVTLFVVILVSNARLQSKTEYAETQKTKAEQQMVLAKDRGLSDRRRAYGGSMTHGFQAWQAHRLDRVLARLEQVRPKADEPDVRGFEWYCLWRLAHQDLATLRGHEGTVNCAAFTKDGKLLASGGDDHTIRIWDVRTRSLVRVLKGEGPVYVVSFSPDGRTLASGSAKMYEGSPDKGIRVWNVATGELIHRLELPAFVRAVAFSPDGKWLAAGAANYRGIHIWNTQAYGEAPTLLGGQDGLSALAFSPDSKWIASGAYDPTVHLWDLSTTEEIATFDHESTTHALAFSPDGNEILVGTNRSHLLRWNTSTRTSAQVKGGEAFSVTYYPDGSKFLTSGQVSIETWNTADGKNMESIRGHVGEIRAMAVSPTEPLIASGAQDGLVKLWALPRPRELEQARGTHWVGFGKNGETMYRLGRTSVDQWNPATQTKTATLVDDLKNPTAIAISPDGSLLAIAQKEAATVVWNLSTGTKQELAQDPGTTALAFSSDGKLLAAGCPHKANISDVKVWDLAAGQVRYTLPNNKWSVGELAFSPDGTKLAVAAWYEYGNIHCDVVVWNVHQEERLANLVGHRKSITTIEFSPDGKFIASGSWDSTVRLWDASTYALAATLEGHETSINCLKFAPNSPRLFSGDAEGMVLIWDLLSHQEVGRLLDHTTAVRSLAISPTEDLLVTASSGTLDNSGEVLSWPAPRTPQGAEIGDAERLRLDPRN